MKTEKNILIAFILNLCFSVFEFFGGFFTGSVAILSDAVHDIGDASSIGVSYFLERKSKKQPDATHSYGYLRYSVIGGTITTLILLCGSLAVVVNAVARIINPVDINYSAMIVFALIGAIINLAAAFFTRGGASLNLRAVNLHMLEDTLGWIVVLIGALVMRFSDFALLDPIMSIGVAVFIFINAVRNLKETVDLFLEKTPLGLDINEIREQITTLDGVLDAHHIHIWSMDGINNYATMHIVTNADGHEVKEKIREFLKARGIGHVTLELEHEGEDCHELLCHTKTDTESDGHHHHHH